MAAPFKIDRVGRIFVVRDDLVLGGSKARGLPALIGDGPAREYVYAGPPEGYAQIALAAVCREMGKQATVFVAARSQRHHFTAKAASLGARIMEARPGYLAVVKARAREYASANGATLLPFGFAAPAFEQAMVVAIKDGLRGIDPTPDEVWSVAGSGTLQRILQRVWPSARFHAVRVGGVPHAGKAAIYQAPEAFSRPATLLPPFPSCPTYDAKAWQFVQRYASQDALFWNVGA